MMNILVTGAAGRVGANVVRRLVDEGLRVRAMVEPGDPQRKKLDSVPAAEVVEADLRDQEAIDAACRNVTHVIHLAAQLVRGVTPVDRFYDVNAFGTLRLLEGCLRQTGGVERFVLASTDGIYRPGDPPSVPLHEDSPQAPADYYGTSKLLGEVILSNHAAQFDIPNTVVRFATVLSPDEAARFFTVANVRNLLGQVRLGTDTNIWHVFAGHANMIDVFEEAVAGLPDDAAVGLVGPSGTPWTLHVLDVRDAVEGVYRALTEPGALGGIYNIASAEPTAYTHAARHVADVFGVPQVVVTMPKDWNLELSIDAARRDLKFAPTHDFHGMLLDAKAGAEAAAFIPAKI